MVGSGVWGRCRAAVSTFSVQLGWAPAISEDVPRGEAVRVGCIRASGGSGLELRGCV